MKKVSIALFAVAISGCAMKPPPRIEDYKFGYENATYHDDQIDASIEYSECGRNGTVYGCEGYTLKINNKSDSDVLIDWNKSVFISGGETKGGFLFDGVVFSERNQPKPDAVVFPHASLVKLIWPNDLVFLGAAGWDHQYIPINPNGVYLVVKTSNGTEKRIKLTATVKYIGKV